jgi:hypothetical protein
MEYRELLDTAIEVAPAYNARIRDDINVRPSLQTFNNAYNLLCLPSLTSKIREMAFPSAK